MPTIGELLKSATKTEFRLGDAKVTIERRRKAVTETPKKEDKGREEYFRLRDSVWSRLREELKSLEDFQRYLKKRTKMMPHDLANRYSKYFRRMIAAELARNTEKLRKMYLVIEFTRRGMEIPKAAEAEEFFNEFFTGKREFRNDYWTYWNRRHVHGADKKVRITTVRIGRPSDTKPYHCPNCNQFVSRKTNYCSRCQKKVSPK